MKKKVCIATMGMFIMFMSGLHTAYGAVTTGFCKTGACAATGDPTNLTPVFLFCGIALIVILLVLVFGWKNKKK